MYVLLLEWKRTCFTYFSSSCSQCMRDKFCGYCYEDGDSGTANGSCLPAYYDQYRTLYDNSSMYGRCSAKEHLDHLSWAYDYCPTKISWMATFGMVLYLACFAPGEEGGGINNIYRNS